jgi:hypothetical protein
VRGKGTKRGKGSKLGEGAFWDFGISGFVYMFRIIASFGLVTFGIVTYRKIT